MRIFIYLGLLAVFNQGCAPLLVGAAAATGAVVATDRRSTGTVVDDQTLTVKALNELSQHPDIWQASSLHLVAYNHSILIVGQTANLKLKMKAERLLKQLPNVRRVINELSIGPLRTLKMRSQDAWITAQIKAQLLKASIGANRVKVLTEHGVVYLLGLVSPEEGALAAQVASQMKGVRDVIQIFEIP